MEMKRIYAERTSLGRSVERISVPDPRILENVNPPVLGKGLNDAEFTRASRRGKYILLATTRGDTLLVHFGMTGDLFCRRRGERIPRFSCAEFHFRDGGCLHYTSKRKLGKIGLFPTTEESEIPGVSKLGLEPLSRRMTLSNFEDIVSAHRTTIHQLLMDQELIAGIGNIYSDEIVFQAGVRPDRRTSELSGDEIRTVFDKMKWVLRESISLDADLDAYPDRFLIPHRGRGGTCPRDGSRLVKKTIAGRSSYYCPECQR